MEIWKDVAGYEGIYQVSNLGRIKSLNYNHTGKEKILKDGLAVNQHKNRIYKRHQISLYKNKKRKFFSVSRIVFQAFHGKIQSGYDVDHIDNNPQNNRLDNLQLLTRSENNKKRFIDNPKFQAYFQIIHPKTKIKCLNNGKIYNSQVEAARDLRCSVSNINNVLKNRQKQTNGYHFVYVNENPKLQQLVLF